jgi:signal transduction histidine kinase
MTDSPAANPESAGRFSARPALFAFALGLAVFVAFLAVVTFALRGRLRGQIVSRDAAVLSSITGFEVNRARSYSTSTYLGSEGVEDNLLEALLEVSRMEGVVALRVFDAEGHFLDAAPERFVRGGIGAEDLERLRSLKPVSRFVEDATLDDFFYRTKDTPASARVPLLVVLVPVRAADGRLEGVGQFLLDGAPTLAAFRELDRNLAVQAGLALAAALLLGGGLMGWSFWRLQRSNRLLAARTTELVRANRELALRSRVSAIGAVTANLIHGLKNPLAALSLYVEERRRAGGGADEALDDASQAARRMARMIEESVSILAQDEGGEKFDYTMAEVAQVVRGRCAAMADAAGVALVCEAGPELVIDNRRGNLLALAAVNLVQNAVQATPPGGTARLAWRLEADAACLMVRDTGPGLPERMRSDPFLPFKSGKPGGSGVGLAIAAELVKQMGGGLRLVSTGTLGTIFEIRFTPGA